MEPCAARSRISSTKTRPNQLETKENNTMKLAAAVLGLLSLSASALAALVLPRCLVPTRRLTFRWITDLPSSNPAHSAVKLHRTASMSCSKSTPRRTPSRTTSPRSSHWPRPSTWSSAFSRDKSRACPRLPCLLLPVGLIFCRLGSTSR
jgi:hypothetical protein